MRPIPPARVGFVGLGAMGEPMALNLLKAGTALPGLEPLRFEIGRPGQGRSCRREGRR